MIASYKGHLNVVKTLYNNGANRTLRDKRRNTTAFLLSVISKHKKIAKFFTDSGESINQKDRWGTAIYPAVFNNDDEMVDFLLHHGINLNEKCVGGAPILLIVARTGKMKYLQLFFKHGADIDGTALISAVTGDKIEILKFLIEEGANINIIRNVGKTALDYAIKSKNTQIIKILRKHGAKTAAELKAERVKGKKRRLGE